jgi:hypothetical protein
VGELSIWPGLGGPYVVFKSTSMLDLRNARVLQADRASHNPPAASSAAVARNKYFLLIAFCFLIQGADSFTFTTALCANFWSSLSIWNEGGEFWCEGPANRNKLDAKPGR